MSCSDPIADPIRLCLELDPDDMGLPAGTPEPLGRFFAGTVVERSEPVNGATLYAVGQDDAEIQTLSPRVADCYLQFLRAADTHAGLIGGYGFFHATQYLFGGDRALALSSGRGRAFARLGTSPVQDVRLDDRVYRILRDPARVMIVHRGSTWQRPRAEASACFAAVQRTRQAFSDAFMVRFQERVTPAMAREIRQRCFGGPRPGP